MKIHTAKTRRHLQNRFLAPIKKSSSTKTPVEKPSSLPPPKSMFSQDEKQIMALASLNMRNQKITNVKSGNDDADVVNTASMKMYVSNAMRAATPVNDRDIINKAHLDSKLLNIESNMAALVDDMRSKLERVHVTDYSRNDEKIAKFEEQIKQLDTNKTNTEDIEQQLKLLKNIMIMRQATLYSSGVNGQFVHGIFFKDAKITSVMATNLKTNVKLIAVYTQVNQAIKKELKLKPRSTIEYDFALDIGTESKFVTFETNPLVGDVSVTIFYEQKSSSVPSQ